MAKPSRESPIVAIYDASCGICSRFADAVRKRDEKALVTFVDNSNPDDLPEGVTSEMVERTVVVIDNRGRVALEADAIAAILERIPGYGFLGSALTLPGMRAISKVGYRWVARNRRNVSGWLGLRACRIPRKGEPSDKR